MVVLFGTAFYGKIATHKSYWVETKFVHFCFVPIFPVGSMIANEWNFRSRKGWEIAINKKSVIATYCRLFSAGLAILMFASAGESIIFTILGLLFAAAWVYFLFFFGKPTEQDMAMRDKLGSITGLYVMPHWLDYPQSRDMLRTFLAQYKSQYPESDWKADLTAPHVAKEKRPLLYGIALFNCMAFDIPDNDELYHIADRIYVLEPADKTPPVVAFQ